VKYKYGICKECKTKRRIFYLGSRGDYRKYRCSKGHTWEVEILGTEKIAGIMQEVMLKHIKNIFERDDTFYKNLKK